MSSLRSSCRALAWRWMVWSLLFGLGLHVVRAQVVISEFLADNQLGRKDEDGDHEDWIELFNSGSTPANLEGWALTDATGSPRWPFPTVTLAPGEYLVVYASAKDRRVPGKNLHTNFRLDPDGEYLALLRPDGSVASAFTPAYPPQIADVSFGFPGESIPRTLLPSGAAGRLVVPTDGSFAEPWILPEFDDRAWSSVATGVGWDATGALSPLVQTDLASTMRGRNASAYLRVPFAVTNVADLTQLELRVRYDDGFVAFLNGYPVAQRNAPVESAGGVVADQVDDWAGNDQQGVKGWYYGWYDASADADPTYDAFSDFQNVDERWTWTGSAWSLEPADPPWTTIARETWHPNGRSGGADVQWAIRRWVSQTAGTVKVLLAGAKENTACGNGVTFRVLVNGVSLFARAIAFNDAAGFVTTLDLENLDFGDFVDFALDPTGPDGDTQDGCDGSTFAVQIMQDANPGLSWNSAALRGRSGTEASTPEVFNLDGSRDRLVVGTNILAFQILNAAVNDADLLLLPELSAQVASVRDNSPRYFTTPTPGNLNTGGVETLGALIEMVQHTPNVPADNEALVVTARVRPTLRPVAGVSLRYRVDYGAEIALPMHDDGQHDDGAAGDGTWGATIPASAAGPGQMIRWVVISTDSLGSVLRSPPYPDPRRSPQYHGTVVADPTLAASRLPVLQWFIQNPGSADSDAGTRASVYFDGEFYDNVGVNVHGQSTRGFPKKSYDFDLNPGFKLRWREGQPRVDDFNLLTTWADKAHMRNALAYETYAQAGAPAHFAIPVRVQQNGRFHSVANLVENGDDNFLERLGLDRLGALYKMYNVADSTSGAEKKTRKNEGTQDLAALITGFGGTTAARQAFLFDQLDVPEMINYLATRALTADADCCHKNYYLYRDTNGSGEWSAFPWDVDLSFGRVWTCGNPCLAYYDEKVYTNTGLFVGDNNRIFSTVLSTPATRQMYVRRIRTLMDELAQAPGVAPGEDQWRIRTTQLRDLIAPDAALDLAKWGTWGRRETITQAVDRIHREFLPGRRQFLFGTQVRSGTLPQAQPAETEVRIARIEGRTTTGNRLHEYLVLTNANAFAVDLSNWQLDGGVHFQFKPGTVLPSHSAAYVSPDRRLFRARPASPRGGERLLALGNYSGELDARGETVSLRDRSGRLVHSLTMTSNPTPAQWQLRLTELMAHPTTTGGAAEVEFIELQNFGPTQLDLAGLRFTEGVAFDFNTSAVRTLAPGQHVLIVNDVDAFNAQYGFGFRVAGAYTGNLDNGGERLRLEDADGEPIFDFVFDPSWHPTADGLGYSLVPVWDGANFANASDAAFWKPGARLGGTPGGREPDATSVPSVVVNEVLTHTDPPQLDAVELHNPTSAAADVSGWWLTDDPGQPRKFRVPPGTVIGPRGFVVFDETHFNRPTNAPTSFSFSSHGDEVWVFSATADGSLSGHSDGFAFEAAANGVSFGRYTNGVGQVQLPAQREVTLGAPNAGPLIGPIVITEIHFAPAPGESPFIELKNITTTAVRLFDPGDPGRPWRLGGVDFNFPPGFVIPPGGIALVVGGDPGEFRRRHAVADGTPVLGPWSGQLETNGERLALDRPDTPDILPDGTLFVPRLVVDEVRFNDRAPWPLQAAGYGASLERIRLTSPADDPLNWRASQGPPSPGFEPGGNRPPIVAAGPGQSLEATRYPVAAVLAGFVTDDGLPTDPGLLTWTWTQAEGPAPVEFDAPSRTNTAVQLPGPGSYVLRLSASDGEAAQSADVVIDVRLPDTDLTLIPAGSPWRYFAADRAPATNWATPGFADNSWPQGAAQLGYGDGDESTAFPDTVNGAKVFSAYFRRSFVVTDPSAVTALDARLLRDDGAAVWLDGVIVHRSNLPEGPLVYDSPAVTTISGTDESAWIEIPLDPAVLHTGTHVLSVEVHQQSAGSSDLSFDFELRAKTQPANRAPTASAGDDRTVSPATPIRLAGLWTDDGLPAPARITWSALSGPGVVTFSATNVAAPTISFDVAGSYLLRFAVSDGTLTSSDDVRITVNGSPADDYAAWKSLHFSALELSYAAISGDDADPDADGQSNLQEFGSGTGPRDAASVLRLTAELTEGGHVQLRVAVVAGRSYQVHWRPITAIGEWQLLDRIEPQSAGKLVTVLDPNTPRADGGRLYRVSTP